MAIELKIELEELSDGRIEDMAENGEGEWGVKLGPNDELAFECPMLGDGGAGDLSVLPKLLASYDMETSGLDRQEGPDDVVFRVGNRVYLLTIHLLPIEQK